MCQSKRLNCKIWQAVSILLYCAKCDKVLVFFGIVRYCDILNILQSFLWFLVRNIYHFYDTHFCIKKGALAIPKSMESTRLTLIEIYSFSII